MLSTQASGRTVYRQRCWTAAVDSRQVWQQQAGPLTIGEGSVGVSELIKEGMGEGPNGCHPGHWAVVQQLGHLQQALTQDEPHQDQHCVVGLVSAGKTGLSNMPLLISGNCGKQSAQGLLAVTACCFSVSGRKLQAVCLMSQLPWNMVSNNKHPCNGCMGSKPTCSSNEHLHDHGKQSHTYNHPV